MIRKIFALLLMAIWLIIIFSLSNTAGILSGEHSRTLFLNITRYSARVMYGFGIFNEPLQEEEIQSFVVNNHLIFRKICHFIVFFILGVLSFSSVKVIFNKSSGFTAIITIIFCVLYSIFDETHQLMIPGRFGLVSDCLIDSCGAALACLILYFVTKRRQSRLE